MKCDDHSYGFGNWGLPDHDEQGAVVLEDKRQTPAELKMCCVALQHKWLQRFGNYSLSLPNKRLNSTSCDALHRPNTDDHPAEQIGR